MIDPMARSFRLSTLKPRSLGLVRVPTQDVNKKIREREIKNAFISIKFGKIHES